MNEKIKLLIAEDNPYLSSSIKSYMESQPDIEVVGIAENAEEALEYVKLNQPNALIADIIMPSSDGFLLLEKLSTGAYGKMPETIILSALSQEGIVSRALQYGAKYFMVKPFDMELLYRRLLDLFDRRTFTPKPVSYTHLDVYKRQGYTHIKCKLETGRTHQIRVHMAYIGHPVSGDKVYGVKNEKVDFEGHKDSRIFRRMQYHYVYHDSSQLL